MMSTGNYHLLYEIREGILLILVLTLGHRRNLYR
jgi:mRNA-degrading endonuclease RelE of RelBE toxin-antitoxin system